MGVENRQQDAAPWLVLRNGAAAVALYDDHVEVNGEPVVITRQRRLILSALSRWALTNQHRRMPNGALLEATCRAGAAANSISVQLSHLWAALREAHHDAPGIVRSTHGYYWIPRECFGSSAVAVAERYRFQIGDATIVLDESLSLSVNGTPIATTQNELAYFMLVAERAGTVCGKQLTLETIYGEPKNWPEYKIIDVMICKLRKKLGAEHPDAERLIQTSWGRGYYIARDQTTLPPTTPAGSNKPSQVHYYLGRPVSLEDLPPPGARWVIARKHLVVGLLHCEAITLSELLARYPGLTAAEIEGWRILLNRGGLPSLRVTRTAA